MSKKTFAETVKQGPVQLRVAWNPPSTFSVEIWQRPPSHTDVPSFYADGMGPTIEAALARALLGLANDREAFDERPETGAPA